jgi:hypothetical protein
MASPYEAKDTSPLKSKRTVEEFYSSGAPDHLLGELAFPRLPSLCDRSPFSCISRISLQNHDGADVV